MDSLFPGKITGTNVISQLLHVYTSRCLPTRDVCKQNRMARIALLACVLWINCVGAPHAAAQILHLDAPPNPAWPNPSSVTVLADALMREADKLDAAAKVLPRKRRGGEWRL